MIKLFVNLPHGFSDEERETRFDAPLLAALGQGARIIDPFTVYDYGGKPVAVNFELQVKDLKRALPILRDVLVKQGAPKDSSVSRLDTHEKLITL
jgi:hypothetical protein